ncbi:tyrosine--tRNA ligase [Candidatus Saccharibacteria bacterium]|nr:tyrosine--tRNA ligase [Candidatus Saccharibacteria bacterium]MCL1963229.1 tyrosine--tRNA ligase [Candidatus Saccharibacteria bacterium]
MTLSEELAWRGFLAQNTFDNASDLDKETRKFYLGCDPSADSLTIGNLAALMMARCFMEHGYEPFLLAGGATGQIGDPKENEERQLKSLDEIECNVRAIEAQYRRIVGDKITVVNNYDWFKDIKFLDFLREVGKQFSMTQLLDREFVKNRIGEGGAGISYAEFSYSLIQGYDFLHLFRKYGVSLQICGADQFGNCVSGLHLIKRLEGKDVDVWSTPLIINKSTGKKFGKSEDGAVWLDAEKTSVYKFYQFWLNVDDAGVIDYMKIYTMLDRDTIEKIAADHTQNPGARTAQKILAREVTKIVHGAKQAENVERVTDVLFGGDLGDLSDDEIKILEQEIPTAAIGKTVVQILVESEIAKSNGEALRLIQQNAISLSGVKISADKEVNEKSLLKKGKNQFVLVK